MASMQENKHLAKAIGVDMDDLPDEIRESLFGKVNKKLQDEKSDREAFKAALERCSDSDLMAYVPDVYQKNIYKNDYGKLKAKGITLISFDIDDTISDSIWNKVRANAPLLKITMPDDAKELFSSLKDMGFTVTLLTNAHTNVAKEVCAELRADGYIARADKPETRNFEKMMETYHVEPSQMAHVGNSMRDDIAGGNRAGVTTCLVRRAGVSLKAAKFVMKRAGLRTKGHLIRQKLLERGLWRKHHKNIKGDQYYQLGEAPKYQNPTGLPL